MQLPQANRQAELARLGERDEYMFGTTVLNHWYIGTNIPLSLAVHDSDMRVTRKFCPMS